MERRKRRETDELEKMWEMRKERDRNKGKIKSYPSRLKIGRMLRYDVPKIYGIALDLICYS